MFTHFVGKLPSDLWARSPSAVLNLELAHEKASSLGRLGRNLEGALQALREFDAAHGHPRSAHDLRARTNLVVAAGHVLWQLVVQREACGLRDSRAVMDHYRVPTEVQQNMGVVRGLRR